MRSRSPRDDYDDFARALLGSARGDRSAPGAQSRALSALGVGAGALAGASQAAAAKGSATLTAATTTFGAAGAAKVAAVFAVGIVVVAAGAVQVGTGDARPLTFTPSAVTAPASSSAPAARTPVAPPAVPGAPPPRDAPGESSPAEPSRPAREPPPRVLPPVPGPQPFPLAAQVRMLDDARSAMAAGRGPEALALLDGFEARKTDARVEEEALALRVEALVACGDRAAASRAAARFFSLYPQSVYARRVRSLAADGSSLR